MGKTPKELQTELNAALKKDTVRMGDDPYFTVDYLPTGVLPVDVLCHGGLPTGRSIEIYGDYSTLKSYIALRAIGETQRRGGVTALVDTEHSYDPTWAVQCGVDIVRY